MLIQALTTIEFHSHSTIEFHSQKNGKVFAYIGKVPVTFFVSAPRIKFSRDWHKIVNFAQNPFWSKNEL